MLSRAAASAFTTIRYSVANRIAHIELNRPEVLNAIVAPMPLEIRAAVSEANFDDAVHAILLTGAGRSFCSGYDLKAYAERGELSQLDRERYDAMADFKFMGECTSAFYSLRESLKPTVCAVQGHCIAGGSDIALCCDLVVMAEDAVIGYPPARAWGVPTTAMWVERLGVEKAKRMLLTGDVVSGVEAAKMGLVLEAVPAAKLMEHVTALLKRIAAVDASQLAMVKLACSSNDAFLRERQRLSVLLDGLARHSPAGAAFQQLAAAKGFKEAVKQRDAKL